MRETETPIDRERWRQTYKERTERPGTEPNRPKTDRQRQRHRVRH